MSRILRSVTILAVLVVGGSALAAGSVSAWWERFLEGPSAAEGADGASVLFSLGAQGAQMSGDELTVQGLDPGVIWFTDRPQRQAGRIDTAQLVDLWTQGDSSFAADPPNAVVSGVVDGEITELVVTLESLREEGNDVVFRVAPLEGQSLPESLALTGVDIVIDTYQGTYINIDNFGAVNVEGRGK